MIIDKMRSLKGVNDLTIGYTTATTRFIHLAQNELIPFAKILKNQAGVPTNHTIINTEIITELYNYGISKEQLPTLKALADYMGAKCRQSHGKWVIDITTADLDAYFATPTDEEMSPYSQSYETENR